MDTECHTGPCNLHTYGNKRNIYRYINSDWHRCMYRNRSDKHTYNNLGSDTYSSSRREFKPLRRYTPGSNSNDRSHIRRLKQRKHMDRRRRIRSMDTGC